MMGHSEQGCELGFEMAEGADRGLGGVEMVESAFQKIVQGGIRVFGLHGQFKELAEIGGEQGGGIVPSQTLAPIADRHFTKGVEIAASGAGVGDFAAEKEVDLALKWTFRPAGTLGDGLDQTMGFREPMDDETGFRQAGGSDHDGIGGLHTTSVVRKSTKSNLILNSKGWTPRFIPPGR